jgi:hypothetical protein
MLALQPTLPICGLGLDEASALPKVSVGCSGNAGSLRVKRFFMLSDTPQWLGTSSLQNRKVLYDLLFRTTAETLFELTRDPRLLGAEIGFFRLAGCLATVSGGKRKRMRERVLES